MENKTLNYWLNLNAVGRDRESVLVWKIFEHFTANKFKSVKNVNLKYLALIFSSHIRRSNFCRDIQFPDKFGIPGIEISRLKNNHAFQLDLRIKITWENHIYQLNVISLIFISTFLRNEFSKIFEDLFIMLYFTKMIIIMIIE